MAVVLFDDLLCACLRYSPHVKHDCVVRFVVCVHGCV